jgi:hypothetical protein
MGLFAMEDQINEKFILPCVALAALTFRVICVVRWQPRRREQRSRCRRADFTLRAIADCQEKPVLTPKRERQSTLTWYCKIPHTRHGRDMTVTDNLRA